MANVTKQGFLTSLLREHLANMSVEALPRLNTPHEARVFLREFFSTHAPADLERASHNFGYYGKEVEKIVLERRARAAGAVRAHASSASAASASAGASSALSAAPSRPLAAAYAARRETPTKRALCDEMVAALLRRDGELLSLAARAAVAKRASSSKRSANSWRRAALWQRLNATFQAHGYGAEKHNQKIYADDLWRAYVRSGRVARRAQIAASAVRSAFDRPVGAVRLQPSADVLRVLRNEFARAARRGVGRVRGQRILRWSEASARDWLRVRLRRRGLCESTCGDVSRRWLAEERSALRAVAQSPMLIVQTTNIGGSAGNLQSVCRLTNVDVLLISEARTSSAPIPPATPAGWSASVLLPLSNGDSHCGGVAVLCRDDFLLVTEPESSGAVNGSTALQWQFCSIRGGAAAFPFAAVYRPPKASWKATIGVLLEQAIAVSRRFNSSVVLGGDFNVDLVGVERPQDRVRVKEWTAAVAARRSRASFAIVAARNERTGKFMSTRGIGKATLDFFVVVTALAPDVPAAAHMLVELHGFGGDHDGVRAQFVGQCVADFWSNCARSQQHRDDLRADVVDVAWQRLRDDDVRDRFERHMIEWMARPLAGAPTLVELRDALISCGAGACGITLDKPLPSSQVDSDLVASRQAPASSERRPKYEVWFNAECKRLLGVSKRASRHVQRLRARLADVAVPSDEQAIALDVAAAAWRDASRVLGAEVRRAKAAHFARIASEWRVGVGEHTKQAFRVVKSLARGPDSRRVARAALARVGGANIVRAWRGVMATPSNYATQGSDLLFVAKTVARHSTDEQFRADLETQQALIDAADASRVAGAVDAAVVNVPIAPMWSLVDKAMCDSSVIIPYGVAASYITEEHVDDVLNSLKRGSAPGLDGVPYDAWRALGKLPGFAVMLRCSLIQAVQHPMQSLRALKASRLVLLPKKAMPGPLDFRPITLLPSVFKVLEMIVWRHLMDDINRRRPEWPGVSRTIGSQSAPWDLTQAGFLADRSCPQQAFALHRARELARASREPLLAMFLDVKKAYDSVPIARMMRIIVEDRRLPSALHPLFWALFTGHTRIIDLPDVDDASIAVQRGVPQGAVGSPFFFNIFIDSLSKAISAAALANDVPGVELSEGVRTSLLLYADDSVLLTSSTAHMQILLRVCEQWSQGCDVEFAGQKSFGMVLEAPSRQTAKSLRNDFGTKVFCGAPVIMVSSFKYLGVTMTESAHLRKGTSLTVQRDPNRLERATKVAEMARFAFVPRRGASAHMGGYVVQTALIGSLLYGSELAPIDRDLVERRLAAALRAPLNVHATSSRSAALRFFGVSVSYLVAKRVLWFIFDQLFCSIEFVGNVMRHALGAATTAVDLSADYRVMSWRGYAARALAPYLLADAAVVATYAAGGPSVFANGPPADFCDVSTPQVRQVINMLRDLAALGLDEPARLAWKPLRVKILSMKPRPHSALRACRLQSPIIYRFTMPSLDPTTPSAGPVPSCTFCNVNHLATGIDTLRYCSHPMVTSAVDEQLRLSPNLDEETVKVRTAVRHALDDGRLDLQSADLGQVGMLQASKRDKQQFTYLAMRVLERIVVPIFTNLIKPVLRDAVIARIERNQGRAGHLNPV